MKKVQYLIRCSLIHTTSFVAFADSQMDDMDVDLDKEFLQDLKELKVLVADKDLLDLHKR